MSTYLRAGRACLLSHSVVGATVLAHGGHASPNLGRYRWMVQVDRLPQARVAGTGQTCTSKP
jgi:hypothetical protein